MQVKIDLSLTSSDDESLSRRLLEFLADLRAFLSSDEVNFLSSETDDDFGLERIKL